MEYGRNSIKLRSPNQRAMMFCLRERDVGHDSIMKTDALVDIPRRSHIESGKQNEESEKTRTSLL